MLERIMLPSPSTLKTEAAQPYKTPVSMYHIKVKVKKGKAIPLQAWTGPEVSRRLKLPDFKTIGT